MENDSRNTFNGCNIIEGDANNCTFALPGSQVIQVMAVNDKAIGAQKPKVPTKPKSKKKQSDPEPELMTFKRGKGVLDGHLSLLYQKLDRDGWIETNEADFKLLFSNKRQSLRIVWTGKYGKGTLKALFEQLRKAKALIVPDGFSLEKILEGHFIDTEDNFLTGLNSSKGFAPKADPVLRECLAVFNYQPSTMASEIEEDFESINDQSKFEMEQRFGKRPPQK